MEVIETAAGTAAEQPTRRVSKSCFECDPEALDSMLGISSEIASGTSGHRFLRLDQAHAFNGSHLSTAVVHVPLEIVSAETQPEFSGPEWVSEVDEGLRRERLVRLLDQQQAWYDAAQRAALAAEQLLTLCEHHQQQWLPTNQQTPFPMTSHLPLYPSLPSNAY